MSLSIPVFISSKQAELAIERDLMADCVRRVAPLEPVIAEEWAPQAKRVREVMLDKVRESPIYVGVFASVYSEPTEMEYREAIKNPYREVMIYVKANTSRDPRLDALVTAMSDDHVITSFNDVRDLVKRFGEHLRQAVSRMILLLQKLGEQPPVSRGIAGSRLKARWDQEQTFLREFGFAGSSPEEIEAALVVLNSRRMEATA